MTARIVFQLGNGFVKSVFLLCALLMVWSLLSWSGCFMYDIYLTTWSNSAEAIEQEKLELLTTAAQAYHQGGKQDDEMLAEAVREVTRSYPLGYYGKWFGLSIWVILPLVCLISGYCCFLEHFDYLREFQFYCGGIMLALILGYWSIAKIAAYLWSVYVPMMFMIFVLLSEYIAVMLSVGLVGFFENRLPSSRRVFERALNRLSN